MSQPTYDELKSAVEQARVMRGAQREFFRTKDPQTLAHCKKLEKALDESLARLDGSMPTQGGLL